MTVLPAPDPIGIPAPAPLLVFLLVFTYALHSLFVGTVVGGTVLAGAQAIAVRRGNDALRPLGSHLARALPVAMAFSITTGVAPLLFVQLLFGQFFYTASVFVGWTWFSVVPVLMVGYYGLYHWALAGRGARPAPGWGLAAALAALAWTAFAMVTNMSLYAHPERFPEAFNLAGTALNTSEPTFPARLSHALLNFVVIGSSYVLLVGHLLGEGVAGQSVRRLGLRWLLGSLAAQAAVSLWYYQALPESLRSGGVQTAGMVVAAASGVTMAAGWAAAARASAGRLWPAVATAATVAMAAGLAVARHGVRMASLGPFLQEQAWALDAQWVPFGLFVALLLAGLALVGYLLWRYPWRAGLDELRARPG